MLEFFTISYFCDKKKRNKNDENENVKKLFENNEYVCNILEIDKNINLDLINLLSGIISLFISIYTAKLAYDCNIKADTFSQIIVSLFGFFFSGMYLLYYFIWHIILQNKC